MKKSVFKKLMRYYPEETDDYWQQHQSALISSGFSRKRYCREQDISYHRFSYWSRKLSPRQEGEKSKKEKESPLKKGLLLPVQMTSTEQESSSPSLGTLHLKNGHYLTIHHERALLLLLEQWRS